MRLHVSGLDRNLTLIELVQAFDGLEPFSVFLARKDGQGRGFGYVTVPDHLAEKALQLDGADYRGRKLRISKAENKNERG